MEQTIQFDVWIEQFKEEFIKEGLMTVESANTINAKAFRNYYEDGMSPHEAMLEDMSCL